jgi:hypothetical protein
MRNRKGRVLMRSFAKYITVFCSFVCAQSLLFGGAQAKDAKMSDNDRIRVVDKKISQMRSTLDLALKRRKKSRAGQDVIQLNCVNEKLSSIKGLVKISEVAAESLREAVAKRDDELKQHEYSKVVLAGNRVEELRLEVEGCVGEMSQYTGNTEVVVETADEVRGDSPDEAQFAPAFDALNAERPPAVTGSE